MQKNRNRIFLSNVIALFTILVIITSGFVYAASVYHGNSKSYVFHHSGCRYYNCKNCVMTFETREEALEAGYRACKVCKP